MFSVSDFGKINRVRGGLFAFLTDIIGSWTVTVEVTEISRSSLVNVAQDKTALFGVLKDTGDGSPLSVHV